MLYEKEAPENGGENRRRLVIALAAAAAAAVVIGAVVVFSGLLAGPKGQLTKALTKSLGAYHDAAAALALPDLSGEAAERELSQSFSLELKELSDLLGEAYAPLEGLGVRLEANTSMPQRRSDAAVTLLYRSKDLLTGWADIRDNVMTVGCPQLLGDAALGADTAALGRDLAALSPELEELENLSFNVFDLAERLAPGGAEEEAAALAALLDAVRVEKTVRAAKEINGQSQDCQGYLVMVPRDAMLACLQTLREAARERNRAEAVLELLRSAGVPEEELAEMEEELRTSLDNDGVFEGLEEAVRAGGDLTLAVDVSGGYIASAVFPAEGDAVVTLELGGGERYADNLSLAVVSGGQALRLTSAGQHSGQGDAFTDSTSLRLLEGSTTLFSVQSDLEYRAKAQGENFTWGLRAGDVSLKLAGRVDAGEDTLEVRLDTCAVRFYGMELARLGLTWRAGPYQAGTLSAPDVRMLSELDGAALEELEAAVYDNAMVWAQDLLYEIPELFALFL